MSKQTALAIPKGNELFRAIALDIGRELVAYIEVMYPEAINNAASTFATSVRNHVYNEIVNAVEATKHESPEEWLKRRRKFRREWLASYRQMRKSKHALEASDGR